MFENIFSSKTWSENRVLDEINLVMKDEIVRTAAVVPCLRMSRRL